MRGTRVGATAIEALLALGLGAAFLGLAIEALRLFSVRTARSTQAAGEAQELGLFVERVRRVLKLAAQVEPIEGGFAVYRASWGGEGVALDRVLVVTALGDEVLVREEGAVFGDPGGAAPIEHRYHLGEGVGGRLVAREDDGTVVVKVGGQEGIEVRVRPAQRTEGPLVLPPGVAVDVEGLYAGLADAEWWNAKPLAGLGPATAGPSGVGRGFTSRAGTVPGPSGPVRSSLYAELSALGPELGPLGGALLPVGATGAPQKIDAFDATQVLMEKGYDAEDASLLAVYLAGMEVPHRFVRAAALASLESRLAGMDPAAKIELIADLHPPMLERADPARLGAASGPPLIAPGSLVQGMAPAEGGRGRDLPQGFGSAEDPSPAGRPPGWPDWEASLSGIPPELAAGLRRPGGTPMATGAGGIGSGADPAPDPEVGVPVALFPPPPKGAAGDESAGQAVARTPDLGAAAATFDATKGTLDARQATLAQRTQAYQAAQVAASRIAGDLAQEKELLAQRQAHLAERNQAASDGSCSCPETKANIAESEATIAKLEKALGGARRTASQRRSEMNQAQSARDQAQQDFDAASAVFAAEADALQGL